MLLALFLISALTLNGTLALTQEYEVDPSKPAPSWCEKSSFGATDLDKKICGW